jgi:hypothetical protein
MLATMSRSKRRPKDAGAEPFRPENLEKIALELKAFATALEVAAARMKDNGIASVRVPYHNSLTVGLDKLDTWTGGAQRAVREAILGMVSDEPGSVPEYDPDSENTDDN